MWHLSWVLEGWLFGASMIYLVSVSGLFRNYTLGYCDSREEAQVAIDKMKEASKPEEGASEEELDDWRNKSYSIDEVKKL